MSQLLSQHYENQYSKRLADLSAEKEKILSRLNRLRPAQFPAVTDATPNTVNLDYLLSQSAHCNATVDSSCTPSAGFKPVSAQNDLTATSSPLVGSPMSSTMPRGNASNPPYILGNDSRRPLKRPVDGFASAGDEEKPKRQKTATPKAAALHAAANRRRISLTNASRAVNDKPLLGCFKTINRQKILHQGSSQLGLDGKLHPLNFKANLGSGNNPPNLSVAQNTSGSVGAAQPSQVPVIRVVESVSGDRLGAAARVAKPYQSRYSAHIPRLSDHSGPMNNDIVSTQVVLPAALPAPPPAQTPVIIEEHVVPQVEQAQALRAVVVAQAELEKPGDRLGIPLDMHSSAERHRDAPVVTPTVMPAVARAIFQAPASSTTSPIDDAGCRQATKSHIAQSTEYIQNTDPAEFQRLWAAAKVPEFIVKGVSSSLYTKLSVLRVTNGDDPHGLITKLEDTLGYLYLFGRVNGTEPEKAPDYLQYFQISDFRLKLEFLLQFIVAYIPREKSKTYRYETWRKNKKPRFRGVLVFASQPKSHKKIWEIHRQAKAAAGQGADDDSEDENGEEETMGKQIDRVDQPSIEAVNAVDTYPVDTSLANPAPVDTVPVDTTPVDASPVDASGIDATPVDIASVEIAPVDTIPVEKDSTSDESIGADTEPEKLGDADMADTPATSFTSEHPKNDRDSAGQSEDHSSRTKCDHARKNVLQQHFVNYEHDPVRDLQPDATPMHGHDISANGHIDGPAAGNAQLLEQCEKPANENSIQDRADTQLSATDGAKDSAQTSILDQTSSVSSEPTRTSSSVAEPAPANTTPITDTADEVDVLDFNSQFVYLDMPLSPAATENPSRYKRKRSDPRAGLLHDFRWEAATGEIAAMRSSWKSRVSRMTSILDSDPLTASCRHDILGEQILKLENESRRIKNELKALLSDEEAALTHHLRRIEDVESCDKVDFEELRTLTLKQREIQEEHLRERFRLTERGIKVSNEIQFQFNHLQSQQISQPRQAEETPELATTTEHLPLFMQQFATLHQGDSIGAELLKNVLSWGKEIEEENAAAERKAKRRKYRRKMNW